MIARGGTIEVSSWPPPRKSLQEETNEIRQRRSKKAREQYIRDQRFGPTEEILQELLRVTGDPARSPATRLIQLVHCVASYGKWDFPILRLVEDGAWRARRPEWLVTDFDVFGEV